MGTQISAPIFAVAIVVSVLGSVALSLLGVYLIVRCRRAKRRSQEQEKIANAALDQAIVSYITQELPNTQEPFAAQQAAPELGRTMSTDEAANLKDLEDGVSRDAQRFRQGSLTPGLERGRPSLRRTATGTSDTFSSFCRTLSSNFTDSTERIYSAILARPLTTVTILPSTPTPEAVASTRRDDVGWPLGRDGCYERGDGAMG